MHVHRTTLPGSRDGFAYLTRFCVHSRSRFVSRAVFRPSEKFARAPFSRRCARACSSRSSCCFAFNCPDLCCVRAVSWCLRILGCLAPACFVHRYPLVVVAEGVELRMLRKCCRETHVCAWRARPLSNGVGSNASCMRSLSTSTTSTPEYDAKLESYSPAELKVSPPDERLPAVVLASEKSGGEPDTLEIG